MKPSPHLLLAALLAACGGDDDGDGHPAIEPPTDCADGRFNYVHDLELGDSAGGQGSFFFENYSFTNASGAEPGELRLIGSFDPPDLVTIEFQDALIEGGTSPARGSVSFAGPGFEVGTCETDGFTGMLSLDADGGGYTLVLEDLRQPAGCGGEPVAGSLAACYRMPPPGS